MRRLIAPLAAALFLFSPFSALAEQVRLTLEDGSTVEGELVEHAEGSYRLRLVHSGKLLELAEDDVLALEVLANERIDVEADGDRLRDVMAEIARACGTNIVVDPEIDERVSMRLREIPWREAVYVVCRMTRCEVEEIGGVVYITRHAKVTLTASGLSVRAVLKMLAEQTKKNIVVGPQVAGQLAVVDLERVHWREALRAISHAAALEFKVVRRDLIRVSQRKGKALEIQRGEVVLPFDQTPTWPEDGGEAVTISAEGEDLSKFMDRLGRMVKKNILVDPSVEETLTLEFRDLPWRRVVEAAARATGCRILGRGSGVILLAQPPSCTLTARKAPAQHYYRLVAQAAGKNIVVASEVGGDLSVNLRNAFWDDAMATVAQSNGHSVEFLSRELVVVVGKAFDPAVIVRESTNTQGIGFEQGAGRPKGLLQVPRLGALFSFGADSDRKSLALFGDSIVAEGQNLPISGAEVIRVEPQRVRVRVGRNEVLVPFE